LLPNRNDRYYIFVIKHIQDVRHKSNCRNECQTHYGANKKMEEWTAKYKAWRNFVFESYHSRLNALFNTLDSIDFDKMDMRLVVYLKEKSRINKDHIIHNTHQEIAYELHSSRVLISRLLKKLEQMGKLELHRNHIKLLEI